MSDRDYVLSRLYDKQTQISHEKSLKSELAQVFFGFKEGNTGQLFDWPETARCVPNSILRSALFGAIRRGKRAHNVSVQKASLSNVTVIHTGPQLDQADLDVWEQCLHILRNAKLGHSFEFSAHQFLKAIGRPTGKSQRDWLKASFMRLMTSVIEIVDGDRSYAGQLIHHHMRDEKTGLQSITINPKIAKLYGDDGWTVFEWKDRVALKNHPLAQWLHGFYATHVSHSNSFLYKVETIHKLCGSQSKNVTDFRKDIRKAFEVMNTAIGWKGEINDKGLITMTRPHSRSQERHLNRKSTA
ncbi:MAG: plasmid replication initiator TrfA [Pseudomonas sp.]